MLSDPIQGNHTASFAALTGRALTIFRAGLALNIISSPLKGLMPLRALVAGFLITTNFANPGTAVVAVAGDATSVPVVGHRERRPRRQPGSIGRKRRVVVAFAGSIGRCRSDDCGRGANWRSILISIGRSHVTHSRMVRCRDDV